MVSFRILLKKPDTFFQEKVNIKVDLRIPVIIVLGLCVAGFLTAMQGTETSLFTTMASLSVIISLGTCFFGWLFVTSVFKVLSHFFLGAGSFIRTLEVVGWGLLPFLIGSCVNLVIRYFEIGGSQFSQVIVLLVMILCVLWCANCWIYGIKNVQRIPLKNAKICVGIPVAIAVVFLLFLLLLSI